MQAPNKIEIESATLEALKWLAVLLMTLDHTNTFLLHGKHPWMFDLGRVAFPLFGFAFAYNMARPSFFEKFPSRLAKLVLIGLIAQVPMIAMHVPAFHLNIMFTLGFAALILYMANGLPRIATVVAIVCSVVLLDRVVDYGAFGLLYIVAAYSLARRPDTTHWVLFVLALALLYLVNGNFFTLGALPVIWAAQRLRVPCPRSRQAFYAYYPVHLSILAALSLTLFRGP